MRLHNVQLSLSRMSSLCIALALVHPVVLAQSNKAASAESSATHSTLMPDAQVEANVLKAFAGAPELADQNITTTTVYGEVTLAGNVKDEATRTFAETLASRAPGVKKVVGTLTIGEMTAPAEYPAQAAGSSAHDSSANDSSASGQSQTPAQEPAPVTNPTPQSQGRSAPPQQQAAPGQPNARPGIPSPITREAPPPNGRYSNRPYGPPPALYAQQEPPYGAQQGGQPVVVPSRTMVRIRINEGLDSKRAQPGSIFDGIVLNDVVADGAVAIPRGATVQGSVVRAKASGTLTGRAELTLQLTHVVLAGRVYPLVSDRWSNIGLDKTLHTVNHTLGFGAVGAIFGAVAGGGLGAAIGAGVGTAAGLGTSAASEGDQALIPPEAILTFHLTQPASLATVSQAEMDRLGYGVPAGSQPRLVRRPRPVYDGYYGPGYYPPYPGYGYPADVYPGDFRRF